MRIKALWSRWLKKKRSADSADGAEQSKRAALDKHAIANVGAVDLADPDAEARKLLAVLIQQYGDQLVPGARCRCIRCWARWTVGVALCATAADGKSLAVEAAETADALIAGVLGAQGGSAEAPVTPAEARALAQATVRWAAQQLGVLPPPEPAVRCGIKIGNN